MSYKNIKWEVFWEIPDCPPFLTSEPARFFITEMKEFCGENFSDCILEYRDNVNIWYLDADKWSELDNNLFNRIVDDVSWGKRMNQESEKYCYPCLKYLDTISNADYSIMTDRQLFDSYQKFMDIYVPAHASGHPANVLEMKNQRLSKYLKTYLMNRLYALDRKDNIDDIFSILTEPVVNMSSQEEIISFYKLSQNIREQGVLFKLFVSENSAESILYNLRNDFGSIYKDVIDHHKNFCWTLYNWEGPANNLEYYIETLSSFLRQNVDIKNELERFIKRGDIVKANQKRLISELDIDFKHFELLRIASDIMFLKSVRKDCMYKAAYVTEPMYREIGGRIGLNVHESRFVFRSEMEDVLVNRKISANLIKDRIAEVILHQKENQKDEILIGAEAKSFVASLNVKRPDKNISQIKGQVAYPGKVVGRVKYINTPKMMEKMEGGDILVAYATQPNLLPAMKKASAFVTDFGGITCHAAIVAREWKVPCIIGTDIATKILKDGDVVEVDANKGIVRIIKKV